MKKLALAISLAGLLSQAHAIDTVGVQRAFGSLTPVDITLQGTLAQHNGVPANTVTHWLDTFSFSMGAMGSFSGDIDSFYLGTRGSTINSLTGIALYSGTVENPGQQIAWLSTSGIDSLDASFRFHASVLSGSLDPGKYFVEVAGQTIGTGANAGYDFAASATAPVPEPSTYALLALGLGAVGLMRRSRMRRE